MQKKLINVKKFFMKKNFFTKKNFYLFSYSILIVTLLSVALLFTKINAFFTDKVISFNDALSGILEVKIDNLKIYDDTSNLSNFKIPDKNFETGIIIKPNEVIQFGFDVSNIGTTGIETTLKLSVNFNIDKLSENGVLLLYPATMSDTDIIDNLKLGNDSGSIISINANDATSITSPAGTFDGIVKTIESRKLDSALPNGTTGIATTTGESSHHYEFKLVFFDEYYYTSAYSNKSVGVKLDVDAKLHNLPTGNWTDSDSSYFKATTEYSLKYIKDGLILLYDGDNNSEQGNKSDAVIWKDLIGSNDGVLMGDPVWGSDNLIFDGVNDRVKFKGDIPQRYTIISTFYTDPTSTTNYQRIYAETPFPSLYIDRAQTPRILGIFGHGVDQRFPSSGFSGIVQTAMTFDGTQISLYINGKYVSSVPSTTNPTSILEAYLGGRAALDRQLKGNIYNFMIYDRVLTPNEIEENHDAYFKIIPIETDQQLLKIGSSDVISIGGKNYKFDDDAKYVVKNNLAFNYNGIWNPNIVDPGRITTYDKVITITNTNDGSIHYYQNQLYVTEDNAIKDNLILHFDAKNNAGTGTHDNNSLIWKDLKGTNDGSVLGGAVWSSNSLYFDGIDDRVTYVGNITNIYSIIITVKPVLTGAYPRLFAEKDFPALYLHSGTSYRFSFFSQGKDQVIPGAPTPSTTNISYVVVTYDGADINLFVNGVKSGTLPTTTNPQSTAIAYLGGNSITSGNTRFYTGAIYDFMIYDRVLTDFEIERSYITNSFKYN